jgi:voltage-gated potassium channel
MATHPEPQLISHTASHPYGKPESGWRERAYNIIFETDTRSGRLFDLGLIIAIALSVAIVLLDSVASIAQRWGGMFDAFEWAFTLLFTVEYLLRLACVQRPMRYATSLFGVIDLLAVLPTYVAIFVPDAYVLMDVRVLRLLRVFRVLKLVPYMNEYSVLLGALRAARRKILVFLSFVMLVVVLLGTTMYVVEGPGNGFTSIPTAIYWAITAVTTVGFGDLVPKTDLGRAIASMMMMIGWGTLAVPTGIISAELTSRRSAMTVPGLRECPRCHEQDLGLADRYCRACGTALPPVGGDA